MALAFEEAAQDATKGSLTIDRARAVLSRLTESCCGQRLDTVTVREHLDGWLQNKTPGLAANSVKRYKMVARDFLAAMGKRADNSLEHVQQSDVIAFRDAESRASKSAQTVNLNVKILRSAFDVARKRGLIVRNPAEGVERIDGEAVQREPFTADEVRRLLAAAPDEEWRGLILLGLYTGGRIGDLSHLCWRNVDLEKGTLCFKPEKTRKSKKSVAIDLHPALHSYLLSLPSADSESAPLFPRMAAKKVSGEHGLSKTFSRIMATAKVDTMSVETGFRAKTGSTAKKGKARKLARRSFHSFRHTMISMMANAGIPEEVRRKVTAHASGDVHARYTHHETGTLRAALAALPDVLKTST
jgi:integrase